ncbi:hypothetical protein BC937DRAFT_89414 [Endogone sp. FLAS-F59071]|nr:hypothetical protein BC937DRAFT_89414 [Endogone sp. FLAS-F59071]|eukprot:RUS17848.1 hypothetical protein BC937DRAFT_89414 [Endogone sp. FLAS-F59071]
MPPRQITRQYDNRKRNVDEDLAEPNVINFEETIVAAQVEHSLENGCSRFQVNCEAKGHKRVKTKDDTIPDDTDADKASFSGQNQTLQSNQRMGHDEIGYSLRNRKSVGYSEQYASNVVNINSECEDNKDGDHVEDAVIDPLSHPNKGDVDILNNMAEYSEATKEIYLTGLEWQNKINNLQALDKNNMIMVGVIRILRRTLPQFIKAFALGAFNPLVKITTIEKPHLNAFVHPCLEAALWHIAQVHYEFGENPSRNHINCDCADGVGFMTSADKSQLVYVEGSKPAAKDDKEAADAKKIMKNLKNIFTSIVKETINNRRRILSGMAVFGGQSFQLRLHLYFLDYRGKFRLNEVNNVNIPRDFSEMPDFIWYYECVLKWAVCINALFRAMELNLH